MLPHLKPALSLQLTHLLLSIAWNIVGVILIARGLPAPGPTASLLTALILLVLAGFMLLGAVRYRNLYLVVTLVVLLGAVSAIGPAFNKPAALWPSDFWRYAGVLLNSLGVIGALWGIKIYFNNR